MAHDQVIMDLALLLQLAKDHGTREHQLAGTRLSGELGDYYVARAILKESGLMGTFIDKAEAMRSMALAKCQDTVS